MALTFYHVPNSTSLATSAVLAELENYHSKTLAKRVVLSIEKGETRTPEYLSNINPNGMVPAIVHDGVTVWESAAVTMYLGEVFGVNDDEKKALYPSLGPKRGEAMKWIVWANATLAAAGQKLALALPADADGADIVTHRDPNLGEKEKELAKQKATEGIQKVLRILDGQLEGKEYLLGEQYSLADTHVWCFMSWATYMGVSVEEVKRVKEWMAKIRSRPALQKE